MWLSESVGTSGESSRISTHLLASYQLFLSIFRLEHIDASSM
jgi:hypothetical protein